MTTLESIWEGVKWIAVAIAGLFGLAWLVRRSQANTSAELERKRTAVAQAVLEDEIEKRTLEQVDRKTERQIAKRIDAVRKMTADQVAARFNELHGQRHTQGATGDQAHAQP